MAVKVKVNGAFSANLDSPARFGFVNAIFLYDEKMVISFSYKDGTDTITHDDLTAALADKKTGSDLDC